MEDFKIISGFGILYRTFLSYVSKVLLEKGLSYSDSVFLVNIGEREGITQEEIANYLAIDKAAVARSVKNMEKNKYIITKQSKLDKRAKELYLSDSGKELFQFMKQLNRYWVDKVLEDMDSDDRETFSEILDKISKKAKDFSRFENVFIDRTKN